MFSEVRSRLQRVGFGLKDIPETVSQADVDELQLTVSALRKQLHQIVDTEIPSNNEACGVATNGMLLLRNELDQKRTERDKLQVDFNEAQDELKCIEHNCLQQREQHETCQKDITQMKSNTEKARQKIINLQAEMKQMKYFQDVVDTETKFRLLADLQNLQTDQERDEIRLRQLKNERDTLQLQLETLTKEQDALQFVSNERQKELSEVTMTRNMYKEHQETLTLHLQSLGGDPNIFNSISTFFKGRRIRASIDESSGAAKHSSMITDKCQAGNSNAQRRNIESSCEENMQQALNQDEQPENDTKRQPQDKSERSTKYLDHSERPMVGGIVLGADTVSANPSSDFLRKLPTIFKLGVSEGSNDDKESNAYDMNKEREIEFTKDSDSISNISQLTDDGKWAEVSEESLKIVIQ